MGFAILLLEERIKALEARVARLEKNAVDEKARQAKSEQDEEDDAVAQEAVEKELGEWDNYGTGD